MDKRERVQAALEGRSVDRVPFTMWRHFYLQSETAQGLAQSTLDFYRQYDMDMIVLVPGPFYMAEGWGADVRSFSSDDVAPYLAGPYVQQATEWRRLPELDVPGSSLQREIETVRLVRAQLSEDDAPLVVPVYSPLTTADMLCNGRIVEDIRSFSNDLRSALQRIADATGKFAVACMEAGADGLMFVSRLAGRGKLRPREYRDFGQQFDLDVLDRLQGAAIRVLHLDAEQPYFDLADRYPINVICWETWRSDPSMSAVSRQFRGALMGGLNPLTFSGGSIADVQEQVADAIEQMGGWRLLIAPSGPLPTDSQHELLTAVRQAVMEA